MTEYMMKESYSDDILSLTIVFQYWKLLALDVGTYSESDINTGGPSGEAIKELIKEDFTRFFAKSKFKSII